jgi:hypothetical protein
VEGIMNVEKVNQYLEEFRRRLNLTMDEFTKDVISVRTYRRHIYNETEMQYDVYRDLLVRHGIPLEGLICKFVKEELIENQNVSTFLQHVLNKQYKEALVYIDEVNRINFDEHFYKLALKIAMIDLNRFQNKISKIDADKLMRSHILINNMVNQKHITLNQALVLAHYYHIFTDSELVIFKKIIRSIMTNEKKIIGGNQPFNQLMEAYLGIIYQDNKNDLNIVYNVALEIINGMKKRDDFDAIYRIIYYIMHNMDYQKNENLTDLVKTYHLTSYASFYELSEKSFMRDQNAIDSLIMELKGDFDE